MIQTGKNRSNVKETCRSSTLSTTNPEWTFLFMSEGYCASGYTFIANLIRHLGCGNQFRIHKRIKGHMLVCEILDLRHVSSHAIS